ncbi:MAG: hypothetical protein OEZ68_09660 [Gammaproteobacteria bacterium]|nr:hypothetical protein [Gammaproteobacteria bacterium]MDH5801053.1 hypothetical protein [Gammaproteobacteria bacterium]
MSTVRTQVTQTAVFLVGFCAMAVSGWYLIEGMLHFAGDDTSKRVFIAAGIIFQITESICFIAAAALSSKKLYWRSMLFAMGCILFLFSIGVMTLAQKAALQSGNNQATALDTQIESIKAQIASLDNVIAGYRFNAEKQSKSVYANSRELGQDSLNRATDLEIKKISLNEKLFQLQNQRKQSSSDFFTQLEKVTGWPALQSEFYFLITRSILLELCGIMLMAFAAHLRAPGTHAPTREPSRVMDSIQPKLENLSAAPKKASTKKAPNKSAPPTAVPAAPSAPASPEETGEHWARSHIRLLKQLQSTKGDS